MKRSIDLEAGFPNRKRDKEEEKLALGDGAFWMNAKTAQESDQDFAQGRYEEQIREKERLSYNSVISRSALEGAYRNVQQRVGACGWEGPINLVSEDGLLVLISSLRIQKLQFRWDADPRIDHPVFATKIIDISFMNVFGKDRTLKFVIARRLVDLPLPANKLHSFKLHLAVAARETDLLRRAFFL